MSHFFDDSAGLTQTPTRDDPADYDALAELFLGADDDAPPLRIAPEEPVAHADSLPPEMASAPTPAAISTTATPREPEIEALVLGHLPILAGAWAAQHARCLAEEAGRPVALARFAGDAATIQLVGERSAFDSLAEEDQLDAAIRAAAHTAPNWSVRVEAPSELDLAAAPSVTRITLLSGANEAAIVAAYRTLKGICELITDDDTRTIAVRIMGASDEDAAEAAQKIQRVTNAFLNRAIEFLPPAQQIGAGASVTLYRGPTEESYESLLATISSAQPDATPTQTPTQPETIQHECVRDTPCLAERTGLINLDLSCPSAPNVQFATDDTGSLHLLAEGENAVEDLLAAEGWADTNADILLAAAGLDPDAEIIPRILTSTPAHSRRLLDSRFRVDLLKEVRIGEKSAWCCVPLNTD